MLCQRNAHLEGQVRELRRLLAEEKALTTVLEDSDADHISE